MDILPELHILMDVVIASVLAGLVGLERETSHKPAGFRTHMIIGGASALLILLGKILVMNFDAELGVGDALRTDPIRIIEAIIVGISFIGAGTILKSESESRVQYLTTAAAILFSAGIGISVALKQYILAVGVTILILLINVGANIIDKKIGKIRRKRQKK
ncbi:MAG: MgtC/SapB family protein [Bacteroidales bacterium]|nr:MgtC/SapB family protein [Bacteroidales bacterium]